MVRGLKDLIAISSSITTGKTGSARYETILDVAGLTKKPVQKDFDMVSAMLEADSKITVWE
jgi:hypothetical protein